MTYKRPQPASDSQPTRQHLSRRDFLKLGMGALTAQMLSLHTASAAQFLQTDQKRIYLAPDDHTDLFWAGDEETYHQAFVEMIDYYLDLSDATAGDPVDFQSRWNCDGSYWIWTYERRKSQAAFERLINRIRDGHFSFPLNALVVCLGGAPAEAVLRGMYYAGQIERRYDLQVQMAIAMENQTLPLGLVSLWAGSGAQYSWKGICNCDTRVPNAAMREHEIYWAEGLDRNRILMKWNSLFGSNKSIGGYAEAMLTDEVVDFVDSDPVFLEHYPYRVIGAFGKGWDELRTLTKDFPRVAREKTTDRRRVIVSNQVDFFEDFEATYGAEIPSVALSFGNEWDIYCTALAEVSASVKRSVEQLRNAEALATLVALVDPAIMAGRAEARDQAWMDLGLFWEHNWGVAGRFDSFGPARIAWQRRLASELAAYVQGLQDDAVQSTGDLIAAEGTAPRFFVFNALSWSRTSYADLHYDGADPVHVVDVTTGEETPSQIVEVDGVRQLRILAQDVPPTGYKVFEIRSGAGETFNDAAQVRDNVIENERYIVTLSGRGAIVSLVDKQRDNREFAREVAGRFINDLGPGEGTLELEHAGPVTVTLRATASGPLSHTTRITFVRGLDAILIHNTITQNFGDTVTWGFGFNLDAPDVWHEEVGAVLRAKLATQGGHYSPRNARYDWLTLNHFADMSGSDSVGVTLSNSDCYFMKLGASTPDQLDVDTPQIAVMAGSKGEAGTGPFGIPDQGGDSTFIQRFALRTREVYDPVAAMRFALEHQNPLVTGTVHGRAAAYPADTFSLLAVSDPDVLLWALKPADDNFAGLSPDDQPNTIVRLWNLAPEAADVSVTLNAATVDGAHEVTHIETPLRDMPVTGNGVADTLAPHQVKTYSLHAAQASGTQ